MKKLFLLLSIALAYIPSFSQCSFTINQVVTDVSCEYGNDGVITANPTGGLLPYTFSLNAGTPQTTGTFNGLTEGSYTLYVTDSSTCMDSVVMTITHLHSAPVLTDPPDLFVCNNVATPPVYFSSDIPGSTFQWMNSNPSIGIAASGTGYIPSFIAINNTAAPLVSSITVIPTGPAPDYCVGLSQSFTITINPSAFVSLTSNPVSNSQTVCQNSMITNIVYTLSGTATSAIVTGLPAGVTYSFSMGSLTIAGGPYVAGNYCYTVTATGTCGSATATGCLTSIPFNNPSFSYAMFTYCQTGPNPFPTSIGAPGGTFSASPAGLNINAITGEIYLASSAIGSYTVKYLTMGPCADSSTQLIYVLSAPNAAFSYTSPLYCNSIDPSPIYSPGAIGGIFSSAPAGLVFNSLAAGSIDLSASVPGTYTVTNYIPASGGCSATSAIATITINPSIYFTTSVITNSCTCNGNDKPITMGGLGYVKYYLYPYIYMGSGQWNYADSIVTTAAPNNKFNNLCTGTYTIMAKDALGCTALKIDNIVCNLQITSQTNPTCNGLSDGEIVVDYGGGTAPYTFVLNPGNSIITSSTQTATYTNLAANSYTITATDGSGNTLTNQATLINPLPLTIMTSVTPASCGQSGSVICTSSGPGPYSYSIQPMVLGSGYYTNLAIGSYSITVTNSNGCSASTIAIVSGSALLSGLTVTDSVYDETCYYAGDGAFDLMPSPSSGLSYLWNNGDTTQDLANIVSGIYTVKISNSAGDCMYVTDSVTNLGINCGSITGIVYADSNNDCMFNGSDIPLQNIQLHLSNGALAFTNLSGNYIFNNVPYGSHTISQSFPAYIFANACTQPTSVTLSPASANLTNIDFKDSTISQVDLDLWMYSTRYVPGGPDAWIKLFPSNYSANTVNAVISFVLNDSLIYNYANPTPTNITSTPNGDSLTWIMALPPGYISPYLSWNNPPVKIFINTPSSYPMGLYIQSCGSVMPIGAVDSNLSNNSYCVNKFTSTAYDPNDKTVSPQGIGSIGGITSSDSVLDYVIRFQNTGSSEAMNIKILDTLSSKVNINTFEVLASSHNYMVEVFNGNILRFKFNNINLPDSNTNEPLSHGFIAYRVHQKTGNIPGDEIKNTASIYFDFNAPIVTNTTLNTIITPAAVPDLDRETSLITYPSPVADEVTILMKGSVGKEIQIDLINAIGQKMKSMHFIRASNESVSMKVSDLPEGYYMLKVSSDKIVRTKKILIAR